MEKNKIMYSIYKYILGIIFIIYYKSKFVNKEYIPKEGPIIITETIYIYLINAYQYYLQIE